MWKAYELLLTVFMVMFTAFLFYKGYFHAKRTHMGGFLSLMGIALGIIISKGSTSNAIVIYQWPSQEIILPILFFIWTLSVLAIAGSMIITNKRTFWLNIISLCAYMLFRIIFISVKVEGGTDPSTIELFFTGLWFFGTPLIILADLVDVLVERHKARTTKKQFISQ